MLQFSPVPAPLSRRCFLRAAGAAVALPLLDAMGESPRLTRSGKAADVKPGVVHRSVWIQTNMGILPQYFFPEGTGKEYKPGPYLELLKGFRDRTTVFSGVSHPDVDGGHAAEVSFLTAAPHPGSGAFKNTISVDQLAAERIGSATRFASFVLYIGNDNGGMSYTRSGVRIPPDRSPAGVYNKMFVQGTAKEIDARIEELRLGRSVLDFVADSSKKVSRQVGPNDKDRLDQYFTSIRELEQQLVQAEAWERKPKPKTAATQPTDIADDKALVARSKLMFDMVRLALESDSTRAVSIFINTLGTHAIPGVMHETHSLTHHGNRPETLDELRRIESAQFGALNEFLSGLDSVKENGVPLLSRTAVLYGTCMGSANSHANNNLPIALFGGGFKHAGHLVNDPKKNYPLPNLFVTMLQRMGLEVDRFTGSTGTMRGLEMT